MELSVDIPLEEVMQRLNQVLPPGLELTAISMTGDKDKPLMATVNAAAYQVRFPIDPSQCQHVSETLATFIARPNIPLEKENKSGKMVSVDLKPGIWKMAMEQCQDGWASLDLLVETGSRLNVKPQELVALWAEWAGLNLDLDELVIHRRALYLREGDQLIEPLTTGCR
jgi:radical SAM-linked protein